MQRTWVSAKYYALSTLAAIVAEFGDNRRLWRQSPNWATVAIGDSRRFCRQSPFLATVAEFGDKLPPKSATIVSSVDRLL